MSEAICRNVFISSDKIVFNILSDLKFILQKVFKLKVIVGLRTPSGYVKSVKGCDAVLEVVAESLPPTFSLCFYSGNLMNQIVAG